VGAVPGGSVDYFLTSVRSGRVKDFVGIELQWFSLPVFYLSKEKQSMTFVVYSGDETYSIAKDIDAIGLSSLARLLLSL